MEWKLILELGNGTEGEISFRESLFYNTNLKRENEFNVSINTE